MNPQSIDRWCASHFLVSPQRRQHFDDYALASFFPAIFADSRLLFLIRFFICAGISACYTGQWRCSSGQCIAETKVCDGESHCNDGSDETSQLCSFKTCRSGEFRCAYGACIRRSLVCDQRLDCVDGSDEFSTACSQATSQPTRPTQSSQPPKQSQCNRTAFQCLSGACVANFSLCDGNRDCADGSDESSAQCSSMTCPTYAFRCDYGACISVQLKCDGNRDCADGSDESPRVCGQVIYSSPSSTTTRRTTTQYRRPTTTTFRSTSVFDRPFNNNDVYDRRTTTTTTERSNWQGNNNNFNTNRRDTTSERYDWQTNRNDRRTTTTERYNWQSNGPQTNNYDPYSSSTERNVWDSVPNDRRTTTNNWQTNSNRRPTTTSTTERWNSQSSWTNNNSNRPQTNGNRPQSNGNSNSNRPAFNTGGSSTLCRVVVPENGIVSFVNGEKARYGDTISNLQSVNYTCIGNHYIDGSSTNICIQGQWKDETPKCVPKCSPAHITGLTINANCFRSRNGAQQSVDCRQLIEPGTFATISCRQGYEHPSDFQPTVICGDDGRWNAKPKRCREICGKEFQAVPFIVGGHSVDIAKVPWHAGIYRRRSSRDNDFENICGGTVISSKLVVTAMHCFWDKENGRPANVRDFKVAVGKSKRELDADEDNKIQEFSVDRIHYEKSYMDVNGLYDGDIVILELDQYIYYTNFISPACLYFDLDILEPGLMGKVAGWGLTSSGGAASHELKVVDLPTVGYDECVANANIEFRRFVTSDKFCAGYLNRGVSACAGDSGGGLVIPAKGSQNSKKYYLRGIVSSGGNKAGSCDDNKHIIFTNLQKHIDLIKPIYEQNLPRLWTISSKYW